MKYNIINNTIMLPITEEKIAVTGMGLLSPYGFGIAPFLQALKNNQSAIRAITDTHPEESQIIAIGGFFANQQFVPQIDQLSVSVNIKNKFIQLAARAPHTIQASLLVALQAVQQANLLETVTPERIGILVAGNNTSQKQAYVQQQLYQQDPIRVSPHHALHFFDSSHIGYISELLNITGEGQVIGAASASGNMALIQAMRLLKMRVLDHCLVVGVFADFSAVELQALRQAGALGGIKYEHSPAAASRPFDQEHEGFIPAQAAACLLLERSSLAKQRNVPVLGYMLGGSIALDAQHSSEPSVTGEQRVMGMAIANAGIETAQVDYINTHGTSSKFGDTVEAEAIVQAFAQTSTTPYVNSTKSLIGHCLFSAGLVEAIATLLQLNENFLHANLNLVQPIINNVRWLKDYTPGNFTIALSNNFAFGGINTAVVLEKGNC